MKVIELIEPPNIEGYPGYWGVKVAEHEGIALVHWNWFAVRLDLGLKQLAVGDEVEFNVREGANPPYYYVRDFHVKDEGEVV